MSWDKCKLIDLCEVITKGTTPSNIGESFSDVGINYIRSEMITEFKYINYNGLKYISPETHEKLKRSQLKAGDILFSMAGFYLGKTAFLCEEDVPANTNQAVALIRVAEDKCNREYVYYYLNLPNVTKMVNSISGQAAQPNINLKQIGDIDIFLPDREIQDSIVNILSAYDDLIENNHKQIKLLEEAAQRLYKEWFIDLHFPGYEDTTIVDGIPNEWTTNKLLTITEFRRGKTITKDQVITGIIPVVAGGLSPAYYHNKANTTAPVITVSASGANAGYVKLYLEDVFASDCSFADTNTTQYLYFVYCFLKNNNSRIQSMQKGSAQPHVYAKDINAMELLIPPCDILKKFCDIVKPYFELIRKNEKQIKQAAAARDRLLPKLMSGELEV